MNYFHKKKLYAAVCGLTCKVLSGRALVDGGLSNEVPVWSVSAANYGFECARCRILTDVAP